jgi:ABC-2 type transport system ATP-binding protein
VLKRMLTDYNRQTGATILLSSHNLQHTIDISTRIVLLEKGNVIRDIGNDSDEERQQLVDYFEEMA